MFSCDIDFMSACLIVNIIIIIIIVMLSFSWFMSASQIFNCCCYTIRFTQFWWYCIIKTFLLLQDLSSSPISWTNWWKTPYHLLGEHTPISTSLLDLQYNLCLQTHVVYFLSNLLQMEKNRRLTRKHKKQTKNCRKYKVLWQTVCLNVTNHFIFVFSK